jgi:hypothetical protein
MTVIKGQVHGVQGKAGCRARLDDPMQESHIRDRVAERDATLLVGRDLFTHLPGGCPPFSAQADL